MLRLMLMLSLTLMLMLMLMLMLILMQMLICVCKTLGLRMGGVWVGPFLLWVLFMVGQSLAHMLSLCRPAGPPPVWGLV
jgi:hypothetical protein